MILFAVDTETHALHREHPAVKQLDRLIRRVQIVRFSVNHEERSVTVHRSDLEWPLQRLRKSLAGKPLRPYLRSGKYAKQRRLPL